MKKHNFLYIFFILLVLTGCQKEFEEITTIEVPDEDPAIMLVDGSVAGVVIDQAGNKIDGATVQIIINGIVMHETKTTQGDYLFNDVALSPDKNLIKAFSNDFSSNYSILEKAGTRVEIVEAIRIATIDSRQQFDIQGIINFEGDDITVNLPAESLSTFSNQVNLAAKYYNFSRESRSLYGVRDALYTNGSIRKNSFSRGVYVFGSHTDDQEAAIKSGFSYEIRFKTLSENSPQEVEIWHFDEKEIIWKNKYTATLIGNEYVFNAESFGHFSIVASTTNTLLDIQVDTSYLLAESCTTTFTLPDINVSNNTAVVWESTHAEGEFASGDSLTIDIGDSPVTLTVYATAPNAETQSQDLELIVQDNIPPLAICNSDIAISFENGEATILTTDVDAGSHDNNCSEVVVQISFTEEGSYQDELTMQKNNLRDHVFMSVTDGGGNFSICFATLRFADDVVPVADCVENLSVSINSSGENTISAAQFNRNSIDDLTPDSDLIFSFDENDFVAFMDISCDDVSNQEIRVWVSDRAGNSSVCTSELIIDDPLAICSDVGGADAEEPTVHCIDKITVSIQGEGREVQVWAKDFDLGSFDNSTDALDLIFSFGEEVMLESIIFTCDDLQTRSTFPLKMWVWDQAGNKDFCSVELQIEDTFGICNSNGDVPPAAICVAQMSVQLDHDGIARIDAFEFDDGSISPLGQQLIFMARKNNVGSCSQDDTGFAPFIFFCEADLGPNNLVTMQVIDEAGRFAECMVNVIVEPTSPDDNSCGDSASRSLIVNSGSGGQGENICIPVTCKNFKNVASVQGAIMWDTNILSFTHVNDRELDKGNSNEASTTSGILRYLWFDTTASNPANLEDGSVLFEVCFDVEGTTNQSTTIGFMDMELFEIEISDGSGQVAHCTQEGTFTVQ